MTFLIRCPPKSKREHKAPIRSETNNTTNSESTCGSETMQKHVFARFGRGCGHQADEGSKDTSDPSSEQRHAMIVYLSAITLIKESQKGKKRCSFQHGLRLDSLG